MLPQYTNRFETSALLLSGLCVIHCLGIPLLLAAIPALANVLALPEAVHFYIVLLALPLSLSVLAYGACQHRSVIPLAVGAAGLLSMTVALTAKHHSDEIILSSIGAMIVAFAHINNWKRRSRCAADSGV
ncbi:MerC domain-containing protein [Parasphingorhabdus sp.]|uniref:MerC domain-containing protein n=1 Tax=Parasphingorhabdus sp. TaxID=2709688 RepID=UPI003296B9D5